MDGKGIGDGYGEGVGTGVAVSVGTATAVGVNIGVGKGVGVGAEVLVAVAVLIRVAVLGVMGCAVKVGRNTVGVSRDRVQEQTKKSVVKAKNRRLMIILIAIITPSTQDTTSHIIALDGTADKHMQCGSQGEWVVRLPT